jgi:hypothetical protein
MKVASSGSVEGIKVGVGEGAGDGDGDVEEGEGERRDGVSDWVEVMDGVDAVTFVVVVVDDAVKRSLSSAARRTMSFALTLSASKSLRASDMSVAVFCAEVSTVRRIPSSNTALSK